ncbi:putative autophagy protein Atg13 [Aspergillus luchuensis]|uniref:Autophagy-related protein 13 n=1 Tax=Aspergillus kawachii TaxID=1069201 RepID=A0A146FA70_ASPKA|nr:autophagy protein 13 [Aspergillus luchuensis]BCS04607.1 autophagy protein 13 [Aspergillus luchuensis]BCS16182.1 autophagy protein 13 [Aspergillus luchuensis]GAA83818.1 autophagy protein Atg13 [Aspergillus luchuensis IFO 4308]GAT22421.1 autophagy protein Atg13 [Aspergillus luchuensis]
MHQHPRSPAPAAPPSASRPGANRSDDRRDQDLRPNSPAFDPRVQLTRGLGIETEARSSGQTSSSRPAKEAILKLNQLVSNYHTKAALVILASRIDFSRSDDTPKLNPKVNRWFAIDLEDIDALREELRFWRTNDVSEQLPPPLIIETYLDTKDLTNNQSLVALDEQGKRFDVLESLSRSSEVQAKGPLSSRSEDVILERWRVELGNTPNKALPADLGSNLPKIYKQSIVTFRTLFTYSKLLPAWKLAKRNGRLHTHPALKIRYRILVGKPNPDNSKPDRLTTPLFDSPNRVVDTYTFGTTESPVGYLSIQVTYRTSCEFRVDDSEALLSSRFMGADDEVFRPSLPSRDSNLKAANSGVGSAPVEKRTVEDPDPSRAYGSLSTFHHVGPTTSASPISALRAARESGAASPSPPSSSSRKPVEVVKASPLGRAAVLANESSPGVARRSSISFPPFKAPPLSASPSLVDPPLGMSPRSGTMARPSFPESKNMPPPSMAASARKSLPLPGAPETTATSSNSASPRPTPTARYSSAFTHRRGRPSSGNINKIDDENLSGKTSATSSNPQPGSGLLAEATGTSADSIHADDENITEFLKMLDLRKDLLKTSNSASADVTARRTTATSAALTRFQRMRDSNAQLSESMSSSMLLQRSSTSSSKQLSGVPPMVAGTSISTASSPGKPISPHTPHTPAIPSRLSSNSIVDYGNDRGREQPSSVGDYTPEGPTIPHRPSVATVNAIDIPTSPGLPFPPYRRPSSAAPPPPPVAADDDEIFPFNLRSVSLGAEERSHNSLSALQRQHDLEGATSTTQPTRREQRPPSVSEDPSRRSSSTGHRTSPHKRTSLSGPTATPSPSNNHIYQPRFGLSRGRGLSGGPHSLSSGSSSLARGAPSDLAERDHDRDGNASGSNSGTSAVEDRRGAGRRPSSGRNIPPPPSQAEEDEPLLFAMSDFGASRRSFEEGRHGNQGRRL